MQNQDDILETLSLYEEMSTFDFREKLGIYPRTLLNSILRQEGYVEKFIKHRRVWWRITEKGKQLVMDNDKVDTFSNMTVLEVANEMSKDIEDLDKQPDGKREGWLKRFKKRMRKQK